MDGHEIAAEHRTKKIDAGMDDGDGTVWIAEKRSQLDPAFD